MTETAPGKAKRPTYVDAAVDDVLAMTMAVAQELAVLRERCDTYERLLVEKQILTPGEVEAYAAPPEIDAAREQWRQDYLDRVLWIMQARATGDADVANIDAAENASRP